MTSAADSIGGALRPRQRAMIGAAALIACTALAAMLVCSSAVGAQAPATAQDGVYLPAARTQTEADEYTRYELLAPGSGRFKIYYEVSATSAGARHYYNPIRKGSAASEESVYDAMTGKPLEFAVVGGAHARKDALLADADPDTDYIKVTLARPVPVQGRARIVIVKTYEDKNSYRLHQDGTIVFDRPLGIKRNKVVLPPGYELVGLTVPSQILTEPDGRVALSFLHLAAGPAALTVRAAKGARSGAAATPRPASQQRSWESPFAGPTEAQRLGERAHQDQDIVYFLQQPETHAFRLYHDHTESRPGVNAYANIVRSGSVASDPAASILDTGESLPIREMSGAQLLESKLNIGETVERDARLLVVPFAALQPGESIRLRIVETYTAPTSYRLEGDELVFDRSFGRPRNAVVLPSGWYCTFSAAPATVSRLPDGRVRLDYWNDRPEALSVLLKAWRRAEAR